MNVQHHYVECECDSAEHVVRLSVQPDDEFLPLWFEFHLVHHRRWWSRIWVAIKYIFGYQSKYGAYDTCCPSPDGARKIVEVIRKVYADEVPTGSVAVDGLRSPTSYDGNVTANGTVSG